MKKSVIFLLALLLSISYCAWSQQVDDTKPMHGEVEKDERYKKIDADFRKDMLEQFGSIDNAVTEYLNYAWTGFYRNDLETAMRRFNQAWLLNPESPDAYFGFAALLEMQGKSAEATRFYQLGADKDRENQRTIICLMQITDCREQLNDIRGAIETLDKIRLLKPDEPFIYNKLGYLYMKSGGNTLAMEAFNRAIELNPDDPASFNNRARLHQVMENYVQAILDYDKSIRLDATYVSAYVNRGIVEIQTGNFDAAVQDFQISVRLDPQSGELRRYLGLAKLNSDDKDGACADFQLAKELGDPVADEIINEYCK